MTLTLTIRNAATLDNGMPTEFVLHRRGALVGRADTCDWSLPDPQRHISSRHCEIRFHDDGYWLSDTSTNGTFVNGSSNPVQGEHRIELGDVILIGDFEIAADLTGAEVAQDEPTPGAQESFGGWNSFADGPSPTTGGSAEDEWGEPQELPTAAKKWEPSLTRPSTGSGVRDRRACGTPARATVRMGRAQARRSRGAQHRRLGPDSRCVRHARRSFRVGGAESGARSVVGLVQRRGRSSTARQPRRHLGPDRREQRRRLGTRRFRLADRAATLRSARPRRR